MSKSSPPHRGPEQLLLALLLAGIAASVLFLSFDAYESGLAKLPLLLLSTSLVFSLFLAQAVRSGTLSFTRSPADLPVMLYLLASSAGILYTMSAPHTLRALQMVAACTLCFAGGATLITRPKQLRTLSVFLVWLSVPVVVIGLAQYLFPGGLGVEFFLGSDRRVGSTVGNPSFLGSFLVLLLPVLGAFLIASGHSGFARVLLGLLCGGGVVLAVLTQSRSSLAGLVVAVALMLFLLRSSVPTLLRRTLPLVPGAVILAVLLLPHLRDRLVGAFETSPGSTFARRTYFWEAGLRAFADAPIAGHAAGTFEPVMARYRSPDYWIVKSEDVVPHAHNEAIEVAVEMGAIGLLLAAFAALTIAAAGLRAIPRLHGFNRFIAAGIVAGLAGVCVDNLANVSLRQAPVAGVFWLLAGVLVSPVLGGGPSATRRVDLRMPSWVAFLPIAAWFAFAIPYSARQLAEWSADRFTMGGLMALGRGDNALATKEFQAAEQLAPFSRLAASSLSVIYIRSGRPAEALELTRRIQDVYPGYPRTWLVAAIASNTLGKGIEARKAIDNEIALRNHPEAWQVRAAICRSLRDTAGERQSLEEVVRQSVRGGLTGQIDQATVRLEMLAATPGDRRLLRELCEEVTSVMPGQEGARKVLERLGRGPE